MNAELRTGLFLLALLMPLSLLTACGSAEPPTAERYVEPDGLAELVRESIDANPALEFILEIDHSRLGAEAGSAMPPARVLLFSDPVFDARVLAENPLAAIDLPFRVLAFERVPDGAPRVIFNRFEYLAGRFGLQADGELEARHDAAYAQALANAPADQVTDFETNQLPPEGIITLESPFDFETTLARVGAAIDAQDDTVRFGMLDFQYRVAEQGVTIPPTTLILFGGPGPGAKAMAEAPTLGLDAFCQKFLLWEDPSGKVFLSFNDLLVLADRQGVPKSIPLRVINRRLVDVFTEALTP